MHHDRRRLLITASGAIALLTIDGSLSYAQSFPSRPLRLIVPFPPGGPTDIVARPLAQLLSESLRQPVLVDNRGGAGGSVGADAVAKAAPDGYTLLMATVGTHAINASLYRKLPYHPVDDFTPIAMAASAPVAVVAGPSGSFTSLLDLIAQAKAKPGEISYGSAGNGTPGHLAGALFANAAGIRLSHIPYKGSAPAVTDLLGGQIPLMFDPLQSVQQHLAAGKLRALAVSSRSRARVQPAVPTIAEVAIPGFELTAWWAVFAPAKLPPELAQRLTDEIERIVASGDFEQKLGDLGVQPYVDKSVRAKTASLADFQKTEIAKWAKAVREAGITLD